MPSALLQDRALIRVSGPDAEQFLQNIITTDLDKLGAGQVRPGALLTPQGKILFDFLVLRADAGAFLLECRADVVDDLVRRLTLYRLRAKVEIAKQDQIFVAVEWDSDSTASESDSSGPGLRDARFAPPARVFRRYDAAGSEAGDLVAWRAFRIAGAVAESGVDYALGDAFPHDVLLDQNGGVGLRKGCYVGQEVVSRMQHRGTARRRLLIATGEAPLPAPGSDVLADGRPIGTLGSVAGRTGLAIVRIDKVKDALDAGKPITVAGVAVALSIPDWASFAFPETASAGDA